MAEIIANPLGSVVEGMLRGHELALGIQRAADEHQAFLTNQVLHNQQMSFNDIQQHMDMLARGAKPVQNGMVEEPGAPLADVTGQTPSDWGAPSSFDQRPTVLRKAGGEGRFIAKVPDSQGLVAQYEMPSAEEQMQRQAEMAQRMAVAQAMGGAQAAEAVTQAYGHLASPGVLAEYPGLKGERFTGKELTDLEEKAAAARAARAKPTILPQNAQAVLGPQEPPQVPGIAGPAPGAPVTQPAVSSGAPAAVPAATPGGVPPLANNLNANRMRILASNQSPKTRMEQIQLDGMKAAAALGQGPDAYNAYLADPNLSPESRAMFTGLTKPQEAYERSRTAQEAETARHNLSTETTAKLNSAIQFGKLAQTQLVNGIKYGPQDPEYWAKQIQENPDTVTMMPPDYKTVVGRLLKQQTGLPLPKAASTNSQTQEIAARNALDGISFIRNAVKNPEIAAQLGPIMGRLGNLEQTVGTAKGLSPQAEQLAQELRTRMRNFTLQEGKAVLGGRLPAPLMKSLQESSPNVKMDANMLEGALKGAEGNAQSTLDSVDRERFGGQMRSREMRGTLPAVVTKVNSAVDSGQSMEEALKTAEPGTYHGSGGSIWIKRNNGKVEKLK